jgi:uncharacterized protein (TIGR00296 family)
MRVGRLTAAQGATLVKLARYSIDSYLQSKSGKREGESCEGCGCFDSVALGLVEASQEKALASKSAAYVTVRSHPSLERIAEQGSHLPARGLVEEVAGSSFAAAETIAKLGNGGISNTVLEISVIAQNRISASSTAEYGRLLQRGKDGAFVKYGKAEAAILPAFAAEQNYSAKELLVAACEKAGLPGGMWSSPALEVHRLSSQVFAEKEPNGKVYEKKVLA